MSIDLSECENEPIHTPGAIQPHGVLIGVRESDRQIILASDNAGPALGVDDVRSHGLDALLGTAAAGSIDDALRSRLEDVNPLEVQVPSGRPAYATLHRSDGLLLIEIEWGSSDPSLLAATFPRLVRALDRLRRADDVPQIGNIASAEVQALTGFERVMVYRFDRRANGSVIAEQLADRTLESYLGLHYPASDIPPQARRLYVTNPIRVIVDAEYVPVPVTPATNPSTGHPLDLGQAVLRSVSPVHCEYLRNMGVRASMSISLLREGALWGLVACHHRQPLAVSHQVRLVAEFVARVLSARINELESIEALTRKTASYSIQARLIDQMVAASRFQEGLAAQSSTLSDLIDCESAAVVYQGEVTRIQDAPDEATLRMFATTLRENATGESIATDCLSEVIPNALAHVDRAAGAIAIPLTTDSNDWIFWFRGEHVREVRWGGDPSTPVAVGDGERLGPRHSFEAWTEVVRGHSRPWADWEIEVASDFRTALAASMIHQAAELQRLNSRLVDESQLKDRFLAAVSHDLRNPLNAILGWARIARMEGGRSELDHALEAIERNATAQNQLIDDLLDLERVRRGRLRLKREKTSVAPIVRQALVTVEPSLRAKSMQVETLLDEGATVMADSGRLRQVVWNLLSNAIKFSPEKRSLSVRVAHRGGGVVLEVEDAGAGLSAEFLPHIFDPFQQQAGPLQPAGLGLGLFIAKSIVELHDGTLTAASEGEGRGSVFTVTLPMAPPSSTPAP